jgi:Pyridoxamine 5'-phosphate oxidase
MPIGLMDYISDCEPSGNPTILAINIATSFKNVASGSNISLSINWTPPYPPKSRIESASAKNTFAYSAANLPRFSLIGVLEKIPQADVEAQDIGACFVKQHNDAKYWLPGNKIHDSEWVRLVVQEVYWIGGFGDRAYIGWIPVEQWRNVTKAEWEGIRLPGEKKGWKEWSNEIFEGWEL